MAPTTLVGVFLMVAEATPETTPESIEQPIDQPVADAGASVADAAEAVSTALDPEAEFAAWAAEGKEGEEDATPRSEEVREQIDFELHRRNSQTFRDNYTKRQQSLDGLKARLMEEGLSSAAADFFVKEAKDMVNSHHADALRYAGSEQSLRDLEIMRREVWGGIGKLPIAKAANAKIEALMKEQNGSAGYDQVFQAVYESAYEKAEQDSKKRYWLEGWNAREKKNSVAHSEQRVTGSSPQSMTTEAEDALLLDMNVPQAKKDAILVKRGLL